MLIGVYMNDKSMFDMLWSYAKGKRNGNGLMNWHYDSNGGMLSGGGATDADEDMAWALLMASDQWSSTSYLDDAKALINAIYTNSVGSDGLLLPGDGWGKTTNITFPDYFSPAYFRVFAAATNQPAWAKAVIDRNYTVLMNVEGDHGLVPDRTNSSYQLMGNYSYDACRTPWRIGMDYCWNGEPRAKAYLDKVGAFFNGIGAANIGDGYDPASGQQTSGNKNMAFIGPAGVAGMPTSLNLQALLDGAFMFGASTMSGDYYKDSLRVITMLFMSGNFVDFTRSN